jgi:hypothetical protein
MLRHAPPVAFLCAASLVIGGLAAILTMLCEVLL